MPDLLFLFQLPQQETSFDCGLFLLHYLELFLAEAPHNFNPFRIYNASNFLYLNWFPSAEASLKRALIQNLIFELLENRSREVSNEQNQSSKSPLPVNNNMGIKVPSEGCSPMIDCNGNMTQTQHNQGIEMTFLERLSTRNMEAANDSSIVLRDLFDSGANNNTGSLLGQLQPTFEEPSSSFYHLSNDALSREKEDETDLLSETSNDSEDICIIEDNPMEDIENEELVSTQEEFVGPSSQDDRDEEKPLEHVFEMVEKTSEDMGDNCDQKEEPIEEYETRAAKRRRLSSTDEV